MRRWLVFLAAVCLPVDALILADELTGEDVEKSVEYLNTGAKQSKNGKLKKEFKDLLTLLEKPDSKEKVDLRSFPLIDPTNPVEGQIGTLSKKYPKGVHLIVVDYKVAQVIGEDEMLVSVGNPNESKQVTLKLCVSTKGVVDGQEIKGVPPGVFIVTGTETYRTANGGSNTVWVLKPFDIEEAAAVLKEARENPKRPAAKKGVQKPLDASKEQIERLKKQRDELERQRLAKEAQKDEKKPAEKAPAKP